MNKAETKEHFIANIKIFVDDLLRTAPDERSREFINGSANDVISSNKISHMKYLLAEFEKMYLEDDLVAYRKIMQRINKEGYCYNNVFDDLENTVNEIIALNKIRNLKQYKAAFFFVEIHHENDGLKDKINSLNHMLADFEKVKRGR